MTIRTVSTSPIEAVPEAHSHGVELGDGLAVGICGVSEVWEAQRELGATHAILIVDPVKDGLPEWPYMRVPTLRMAFHDVWSGLGHDEVRYAGPRRSHVDSVLAFVRQARREAPSRTRILIMDNAGVSRAAAVGIGVMMALRPGMGAYEAVEWLVAHRGCVYPNTEIIAHLDAALGLGGEAVKAIGTWQGEVMSREDAIFDADIDRRPREAFDEGPGPA